MSDGTSWRAALAPLVLMGVVLFLGGCVDEESVFEREPFFEEPSPAAGGFLGYVQAETGSPVCGSCHAQPFSQWEETAHAGAWADLQASGHAQEFCENCHTVNQLGNPETEDGGWAATADPRFQDVQCESCHGPGQTHVSDPEVSQPIPSIAVGVDLSSGCGECHQGTHHPFVEEWSLSKHSEVIDFAAAREECAGCHRGQGILDAWGVHAEYIEKDSEEHLPIVCAVCHDPHDPTNEGQLRFPIETTDIQVHLCARCHDRRTVPDPNSTHGLAPHAPEAELLTGEAGWIPPGANIDRGRIVSTHGSERNEALCATCHVNMYAVTDAETGAFVFQATGHLFEAIPCVDEQGIPTGGECALSTQARSFRACAEAGCHATEEAAAALLNLNAEDVEALASNLLALLQQVDPNLDDEGGEIDATVPTFTIAEGAFFNYSLATHGGDVHGSTVHNPFLVPALLTASIQAVLDEYGPSLAVDTGF